MKIVTSARNSSRETRIKAVGASRACRLFCALFIACFLVGCAARAKSGEANIAAGATVGTVDTGARQTEKGTSIEDAQITGNITTSNADLSKGWAGMLVIAGLIALALLLGGWAAPAPSDVRVRLILWGAAGAAFLASILMAWSFYK